MSTSAFPSVDLTADATKVLQRTGYVTLKGLLASNPGTVQAFIQCFNAAATGDVNLGTTVADYIFKVPAGVTDDDGAYEMPLNNGLVFGKGLVTAVTTTAGGSGAPTPIVLSIAIV